MFPVEKLQYKQLLPQEYYILVFYTQKDFFYVNFHLKSIFRLKEVKEIQANKWTKTVSRTSPEKNEVWEVHNFYLLPKHTRMLNLINDQIDAN